jgi:hypothetical protein
MSEVGLSSGAVAILVVNFRRAADTVECLDSLLQISNPTFDIFLADNGSGDTDATQLHNYANRYPDQILFTSFPENYGFTGAHNRLLEQIIPSGRYEFILLLNNDTVVDPEFLTRMLAKIDQEQRIEMVAARMMKYDDRTHIDNLGITFYKCGLASNRKSPDDPLLGPCGGCALYTTELLRQVYQATGEYFDEHFFCYAEDTDLAWRAVLLGYRAAYADDAFVYHKGSVASGGPNSDFVLYHGIRNSLFVLIKDVPVRLLLRNIGWIVLLHGAILLRYAIKGRLLVVLRLYRDFICQIPIMSRKHRRLQNQTSINPVTIKWFISPSFYEKGYTLTALFDLIRLPISGTHIKPASIPDQVLKDRLQ